MLPFQLDTVLEHILFAVEKALSYPVVDGAVVLR